MLQPGSSRVGRLASMCGLVCACLLQGSGQGGKQQLWLLLKLKSAVTSARAIAIHLYIHSHGSYNSRAL